MKIVTGALVSAILLACTGAAVAQEQTVSNYVRGLVEEYADPSETLVGDIQVEELEIDASTEFVFEIDPEKTYFVYGACDDDCYDVDLFAHDANEKQIDADDAGDDVPSLIIPAGASGDELHVVVQLVDCDWDTCVVGFGVYAQDD